MILARPDMFKTVAWVTKNANLQKNPVRSLKHNPPHNGGQSNSIRDSVLIVICAIVITTTSD